MVEGWSYVTGTPVVRGLVVGISGAFAAGAVVIGLGRTYVEDLGAGDPGYGVLFGAVFGGLALGMGFGPRFFSGLSRRRLVRRRTGRFRHLPGRAGADPADRDRHDDRDPARLLRRRLLGLRLHPARSRGPGRRPRADLRVRPVRRPHGARGHAGDRAVRRRARSAGSTYTIGGKSVTYNGASMTMLIAAIVAGVIGLVAWRQMDDRPGVPFWRRRTAQLRQDSWCVSDHRPVHRARRRRGRGQVDPVRAAGRSGSRSRASRSCSPASRARPTSARRCGRSSSIRPPATSRTAPRRCSTPRTRPSTWTR